VEVEPFLEGRLVQPSAVEASGHGELDVTLERRIVRCGHERVGPVPLVYHESLDHQLAAQQHAVAADRDRA